MTKRRRYRKTGKGIQRLTHYPESTQGNALHIIRQRYIIIFIPCNSSKVSLAPLKTLPLGQEQTKKTGYRDPPLIFSVTIVMPICRKLSATQLTEANDVSEKPVPSPE